ncbi:MAG: YdcH family protein [Microvirgula sp.]
MFPEYRELISQLNSENGHFEKLFDKHNEMDQQIKNIEAKIEPGSREALDSLKKEKLKLKDQLYDILQKADAAR